MKKRKSVITAFFLALFFGGVGAHLFYLRKYVRGVIYLLFSWTFIPVLLGWIDILFLKKWTDQLNDRIEMKSTQNKVLMQEHTVEKENDLSEVLQEVKAKTQKVKSVLKESLSFYNEEDIILPKYKHLQANQDILAHLKKKEKISDFEDEVIRISVSYSGSASEFVKDSLRYAHIRGKETKEIPFKAYYPTFRHLNKRQLKWYFYWREQVLNGNYLQVDLSYIFIFVYELLNYSFNRNAAFNVSMLVRLLNYYKEDYPELEKYLKTWIADMLYELGEIELAEEWDNSNREIVSKLYKTIRENIDQLDLISINEWKPYIRNYRETAFFQKHKYKIYNKFKKGVFFIQKAYKEKGTSVLEEWFEVRESRTIRTLYANAVVERIDRQIHVPVIEYRPKQKLYDVLTNLFRLSENIVRIEIGEKRLIKVDETKLPKNIKDQLLDVNQRFKVVQKEEKHVKGSTIPAPPKDIETEEEKNSEIEFDWEEIKQKEQELLRLQQKIEASDVDNEENQLQLIDESDEIFSEKDKQESDSQQPQMLNSLFSDTDEDLEDFVETLTNIEKEFLLLFENNVLSLENAKVFTKNQGVMLGLFITEINEKANKYIGDILLDEKEDAVEIIEDYEEIIPMIRGAENED